MKMKKYSHIASILFKIAAMIYSVLTIKHIWHGENFALSMSLAACCWILSSENTFWSGKKKFTK
ncbi:hypothetical protein [Anaerosporobacter sp.]|uniref:hypothetical protein n=1 Tax=Anaerosporobacter sp. TaxID=1872529 RepID=UPI00286F93BD|nr:hypothetical protein [Anaerosporobacter sp.]